MANGGGEVSAWIEYEAAADQLAREGKKGEIGCPLPANMTPEALALINNDPDAFAARVKACAYAQAQENAPDYCACGAELTQNFHCAACGRIIGSN
jgi:hypothetical protein